MAVGWIDGELRFSSFSVLMTVGSTPASFTFILLCWTSQMIQTFKCIIKTTALYHNSPWEINNRPMNFRCFWRFVVRLSVSLCSSCVFLVSTTIYNVPKSIIFATNKWTSNTSIEAGGIGMFCLVFNCKMPSCLFSRWTYNNQPNNLNERLI